MKWNKSCWHLLTGVGGCVKTEGTQHKNPDPEATYRAQGRNEFGRDTGPKLLDRRQSRARQPKIDPYLDSGNLQSRSILLLRSCRHFVNRPPSLDAFRPELGGPKSQACEKIVA